MSVQLHPNDELAKERHNSFGKSEMWHIVQADKNSKLIVGFNTVVDKRIYSEAIEKGDIVSLLNFVKVDKRDSFFINSGTVHAIGAGILLAEIQQTSDITYRVFDWKRKGFNGKERELHTGLAYKAINYNSKDHQKLSYDNLNTPSNIITNKFFTTNYISIKTNLTRVINQDSFKIYMCVQGSGVVIIDDFIASISCGETVLIPAKCKELMLKGEEFELLEIYLDCSKL